MLAWFVVPVKLHGFPVRVVLCERIETMLVAIALVALLREARPKLIVVRFVLADLGVILLRLVIIELVVNLRLSNLIRARFAGFAVGVFGRWVETDACVQFAAGREKERCIAIEFIGFNGILAPMLAIVLTWFDK